MKIDVVLVRTEHSANIGSAARAMANMGADRLILVDPRCKIDLKARQNAAGAQEQLQRRVSYKTWEDFFNNEEDGIRIALSRRGGRKRKVFALTKKIEELNLARPQKLYLIFGPEADGLDSNDLAFVNFCCHLPAYSDFASYNLGQAVLASLLLIRQIWPVDRPPKQVTGAVDKPVQKFYFPDQLIKDWLVAMGFDIRARKSSAYLTLRRLFLQNLPTRHEIQVLEAILQQNIRKLKDRNSVALTAKELADDRSDITRQ